MLRHALNILWGQGGFWVVLGFLMCVVCLCVCVGGGMVGGTGVVRVGVCVGGGGGGG